MKKLSRFLKKLFLTGCLFIFIATIIGCASKYTTIAPTPPKKYEKLGYTSGSASGSLGVLGTAYYFIPMGLNSRVERAYENALNNSPGATGLINVTLQESWFWWVIGTNRVVTISGEAIKEVAE